MKSYSVQIDATGLIPGAVETGSWRVVQELSVWLTALRPEQDVAVVCKDPSVLGEAAERIQTRSTFGPTDLLFRPHQVLRNSELRQVFGGPWKVVLNQQDTIAVDFPEYYPSRRHFELVTNVQRSSLRRADFVTTISESAKRDVLQFCPDLEPRRFDVVYDGADHEIIGSIARPAALAPTERFLTVVGSSFLHKNRMFALAVLRELRQRGYQGKLVFIGPEPFFGSSVPTEQKFLLQHRDLADSVVSLGPVPNSEKWWILQNADAVLYPSKMEGFGLIPFEAALAGTPCLSARVSSLPEVYGPDATLANGFDAQEWASILYDWIENPPTAVNQVSVLQRRREDFRWEDAAVGIWNAFDKCIAMPKRWPSDQLGPPIAHVERNVPGLSTAGRLVNEVRRVQAFGWRYIQSKTGGEPLGRGFSPSNPKTLAPSKEDSP